MGNECNYHPHNHRPTFLPMLCSRPSSIKQDVSLPMSRRRDHHRSRSRSDEDDDPLSPKISCIGQVKRNNKIVGLPALTTSHHKFTIAATTPGGHQNFQVRYFKLRRLFSGKNLTTTANAAVRSCGKGTVISSEKSAISESNQVPIRIENLDPPLPVIRRAPKQEGEKEEREPLWKRRSSGNNNTPLGSLQIKELQLKRNNLSLPTHTATV